MKWLRRALMALAVVVVAVLGLAVASAWRTTRPVGMQVMRAEADGRAFPVAVWYPTRARPWPTTLLGAALLDVARDAPPDGTHLRRS
ncbi:hypothetical protein [Lysobacter claricitrinus]|uniref:hypothetical protein n=1 Tax=Lysobacter claricitrinus TaxID=3367728 RepID=UPI0037DB3A01